MKYFFMLVWASIIGSLIVGFLGTLLRTALALYDQRQELDHISKLAKESTEAVQEMIRAMTGQDSA